MSIGDEFEKKATSRCIRAWSLVMVRQISWPAREVNEFHSLEDRTRRRVNDVWKFPWRIRFRAGIHRLLDIAPIAGEPRRQTTHRVRGWVFRALFQFAPLISCGKWRVGFLHRLENRRPWSGERWRRWWLCRVEETTIVEKGGWFHRVGRR